MHYAAYRRKFTLENTPSRDRPLIAQICGSDIENVVATAKVLEPYCDGIDINCGCPQKIAKRGQYGAYLLEQPDVLLPVVRALIAAVRVPVSVKVRLLPAELGKENLEENEKVSAESIEQAYEEADDACVSYDCATVPAEYQSCVETSLQLYRQLVDAGIHMLTIHGRTRHQKGPYTSQADWKAIRQVVDELGDRIPILANGGIACAQDARDCLEQTGCDGIMSSEGLLEYPPLFLSLVVSDDPPPSRRVGRLELARRYLEYARQYPPHEGGQGNAVKCPRIHIHRFCHADLQDDSVMGRRFRDAVVCETTLEGLVEIVKEIQAWHDERGHDVETEELSWYRRHAELNENGVYVNVMARRRAQDTTAKATEPVDESETCFAGFFGGNDEDEEGW